MTGGGLFRCFSLSFVTALLTAGQSIAQVPDKLAPPAGTVEFGAYAAKGVQIYACVARGAANEWVFKAPEAQLVDAKGAVFARHSAGPTWAAADGSKIVGKMIQTMPAPTDGAIPWLLLSTESSGTGVLAGARFVQRIKTAGGVAPAGACPTPGAEERVPYTAEYVIYK